MELSKLDIPIAQQKRLAYVQAAALFHSGKESQYRSDSEMIDSAERIQRYVETGN